MLSNRLKVLLAERNLQIKQLVENTNISRNTLSNLINKPTGNISIKTVNELCIYLKITPADFFEFSPFDFSFKIDIVKPAFNMKNNMYFIQRQSLKFYFYILVINSEGTLKKFEYRGINTKSFSPYSPLKLDEELTIKLTANDGKSIDKFWNSQVEPILKVQAWNEIKTFIAESLTNRLKLEYSDFLSSEDTSGIRVIDARDINLFSDFMND